MIASTGSDGPRSSPTWRTSSRRSRRSCRAGRDQPSGIRTLEPWRLRATTLDLDVLAQTESLFALGNGHIGWRANLDEGEPYGLPGSYLNGVLELRTLPYAEPGYGNPESGQRMINVTNGKVIRLLVNDEPFDFATAKCARMTVPRFRDGVYCVRPSGCPRRAAQSGRLHPVGLARAPLDRRDLLSGPCGRPKGADRGSIRAGRQRTAATQTDGGSDGPRRSRRR